MKRHMEGYTFTKLLASDVDDAAAFDLLSKKTPLFGELSKKELQVLGAIFSVLRLQDKEDVLVPGEAPTFFGVLLEGTLKETVDNSGRSVPSGSSVGVPGYLQTGGAVRASSVVSSGPATLAVLQFEDLLQLRGPNLELQLKLVKILLGALNSSEPICGAVEKGGGKAAGGPESLVQRRLRAQPDDSTQVMEIFTGEKKGKDANTNYIIFSLKNKLLKTEDELEKQSTLAGELEAQTSQLSQDLATEKRAHAASKEARMQLEASVLAERGKRVESEERATSIKDNMNELLSTQKEHLQRLEATDSERVEELKALETELAAKTAGEKVRPRKVKAARKSTNEHE